VKLAVGIAVIVGLAAIGLALSLRRRDRLGLVLALLVALAAVVAIVGAIRFDDVISSSDCVGVCVGEFAYYSAWVMAWGGGLVLVGLVAAAAAPLISRRH
jgi:hypothetical protein